MKGSGKYLLVTLIIGWFLGAASGVLILHWCHENQMRSTHNRERFYRKMELTPDQRAKADTLLQTSREKIDQIYTDVRPKVEEIRNTTHAQLRAILTPDQQAKFDKMDAKWRERLNKRLDRLQESMGGTSHN